jgi:hypothetical protein
MKQKNGFNHDMLEPSGFIGLADTDDPVILKGEKTLREVIIWI